MRHSASFCSCLLLTGFFFWQTPPLAAQVEMVYDAQEQVQEVNPLNPEGRMEGVGVKFHASGGIAHEITYANGQRHGEATTYYEDGGVEASWTYARGRRHGLYTAFYPGGRLRMLQDWRQGQRQGETYLFFPSGGLQAYVVMNADTLVFAQRFDGTGQLVYERLTPLPFDLDTTALPAPRYFLDGPLQAGQSRGLSVFIPEVPTAYVDLSTREGTLQPQDDTQFPFRLTPAPGHTQVTLYLRIRLRPEAQPVLLREVVIPVK